MREINSTLCPIIRDGPPFRFGGARREIHAFVFIWAVGFLPVELATFPVPCLIIGAVWFVLHM